MKRLLLVLLMVAATLPTRAAQKTDPLAGIQTVGIISAIGHRVMLKNVGLTVFSNTEAYVDGEFLGLDDLVIKQATEALSPRFTVKAVDYDKATFWQRDTGFLRSQEVPVEKLIVGRTGSDNVDAYVVIVPTNMHDPTGTNQFLSGIGLYRRSVFAREEISVFAFYRVIIVDGHTGKTLRNELARTRAPHTLSNLDFSDLVGGMLAQSMPGSRPFVTVVDSLWAPDAASFDDTRKRDFGNAIVPLVEQSLSWTLADLGLAAPRAAPVDAH